MAAREELFLASHLALILAFLVQNSAAQGCVIHDRFRGEWYSREKGEDTITIINANEVASTKYGGQCQDIETGITSPDAGSTPYAKIFIKDGESCYKCLMMYARTPNVLQYKQAQSCLTVGATTPTLQETCAAIKPNSDLVTMFRKTMAENINCKSTLEGVFQFSYEYEQGGGGICNSTENIIEACQEPGSLYTDNRYFTMIYSVCPGLDMSKDDRIRYECMGTWQDENGNTYAAVLNTGEDVPYARFRCMLTRKEQQRGNNLVRWSMSTTAECTTLKSPYEGPIRLATIPVVGASQLRQTTPACNLPRNFTGTWFTTGEYDSIVEINSTHIYMKTQIDQFTTRETYYTCQQTQGSRYMMVAVTRGICQVEYVCFDFLPRHHNIIRFRRGKPYELTDRESKLSNFLATKFRQACSWFAFTLNEEDYIWKYQTFILNDPNPVECPIAGIYRFEQIGDRSEQYVTRFRGVTDRPRTQIDCRDYESEIAICNSRDAKKLLVDAERCLTVDQNARPVGEYDMPDNELICVGYWLEDAVSYLVTYDVEDSVSKFRCWVYERQNWKDIYMSRATRAHCGVNQHSRSFEPREGASLALKLFENEKVHDDCPQLFDDGKNPWNKTNIVYVLGKSSTLTSSTLLILFATVLTRIANIL